MAVLIVACGLVFVGTIGGVTWVLRRDPSAKPKHLVGAVMISSTPAVLLLMVTSAVAYVALALAQQASVEPYVHRGEDLTEDQLSFLKVLGVVPEGEKVHWIGSYHWADLRGGADIVTSSRFVEYFRTGVPEVWKHRADPGDRMVEHDGAWYFVIEHDLASVTDVKANTHDLLVGNYLVFEGEDGSWSMPAYTGASLNEMRTDILAAVKERQGR